MEEYREFIELFVDVWHKGLRNPARTQAQTLEWLVEGYARTIYGQQLDLMALQEQSDDPDRFFEIYRRTFPVVTYDQIKPRIDRDFAGDAEAMLP